MAITRITEIFAGLYYCTSLQKFEIPHTTDPVQSSRCCRKKRVLAVAGPTLTASQVDLKPIGNHFNAVLQRFSLRAETFATIFPLNLLQLKNFHEGEYLCWLTQPSCHRKIRAALDTRPPSLREPL